MKFKYAYPNFKLNSITLSVNALAIRPFRDEEIEIVSIKNNSLFGKTVYYENSRITNLDVDLVRDEDTYLEKKFIWFGKIVKKVKDGWVRLKVTEDVEIELKNMIVVKNYGKSK